MTTENMGDHYAIDNGVSYGLTNDGYVIIYGLYVFSSMRGCGEARRLMDAVLREIKKRYPKTSIKIEANPYGKTGLNKEQLLKFYSKYKNIEVISDCRPPR